MRCVLLFLIFSCRDLLLSYSKLIYIKKTRAFSDQTVDVLRKLALKILFFALLCSDFQVFKMLIIKVFDRQVDYEKKVKFVFHTQLTT